MSNWDDKGMSATEYVCWIIDYKTSISCFLWSRFKYLRHLFVCHPVELSPVLAPRFLSQTMSQQQLHISARDGANLKTDQINRKYSQRDQRRDLRHEVFTCSSQFLGKQLWFATSQPIAPHKVLCEICVIYVLCMINAVLHLCIHCMGILLAWHNRHRCNVHNDAHVGRQQLNGFFAYFPSVTPF